MKILIEIKAEPGENGFPSLVLYYGPEGCAPLRLNYTGNEAISKLFADCKDMQPLITYKIHTSVASIKSPEPPTESRPLNFDGTIKKNDIVRCVQALTREDGFTITPGKNYRVLDIIKSPDGATVAYEISDDAAPCRIAVAPQEIVFERRDPPPYRRPDVFEMTHTCGECKNLIALVLEEAGTHYSAACPLCQTLNRVERKRPENAQ